MTGSTGKSLTYNSIIWKLFIYGRGKNSRAGNIPRLLKIKTVITRTEKMNEFFIFTLKSDNKKDKGYFKNRGKVYEEILSK